MACSHYVCQTCVELQELVEVTRCGVCDKSMVPYAVDLAFSAFCDREDSEISTTLPVEMHTGVVAVVLFQLASARERLASVVVARQRVADKEASNRAVFHEARAAHQARYAARYVELQEEAAEIQRTRTDGSDYIRIKFPTPEEIDADFANSLSTVTVSMTDLGLLADESVVA